MRQPLLGAVCLGLMTLPTLTSATNGYWSIGYGTKSKSIAGACVAMRFGSMCAAANPGSLAFVGNRVEAGLALFMPKRGFTANADMEMPPQNYAFIPPGDYESKNDWFLIPHFSYNREIDDKSTIGIAIGANGGMNTEYGSPDNPMFPLPSIFSAFNPSNQPGMNQIPGIHQFDATAPTGIDMMQMFIGVSYSRKLNEHHAIGITPILAVQSMEVDGLEPFAMFSKYSDKVTGKGRDLSFGGGLRVGWSGEVADGLILGASYQTKMWMTPFDDYKGLFAEEGDFDIPANFDLGFSYRFKPQWTFAFDYQRIMYSDVKAIGNTSDIIFSPDRMGPDAVAMMQSMGMPVAPGMGQNPALGSDNGLGFGWEDMNVYKFGLQWQQSPRWTYRVGYSYATDVVPGSQALFNVLAPATVKNHFTFGLTHRLQNDHEVNLAVVHATNHKIHGQNPNTGPQTGFIEMSQWEVELGWAMKF
ncbi:OmpP1/FadL family transporter [Rhabdochromatium marinum]|uniref:OmpP1/FadL family transporter n=1 Tax=Rhabdochromatium marinum TaxID=48729 RepID=UPI0019034068|nr:outer membrane protein transport protein [Rhabdochromatium marinum]